MTTTELSRPLSLRAQRRLWTDTLRLRLWLFLLTRKASIIYLSAVLVPASVIRIWNFWGSPGGWNDDEGTYVSQAWAILHDGKLAHYTYWYDHPPFGWMQIAGWAWLTDAFAWNGTAVMVGRELVALYAVIGGVLMYALCRRLGFYRGFSALAVALLMLSPIAQTYGRMVYLDTLGVPWVLAALLVATYSRRSHFAALGAGALLAGAILTKETMAAFAPGVLWIIWQQSSSGVLINGIRIGSMRLRNLLGAAGLCIGIGSFYILMAALKGELFPGKGHVSLWYALTWQLGDRGSSGTILDPTSLSYQWFSRWMATDWLLFAIALPMIVIVAFRRELRPIVLLAVIHIALLVRNGYLPIPFIIIVVPISALLVAGGLDVLWHEWQRSKRPQVILRSVSAVATIAIIAVLAIGWYPKTLGYLKNDDMSDEEQAVAYIVKHSPPSEHQRIVVDDNVWPDLIDRGYTRTDVDWFYKLDVDPAVTPRYIPVGGTAKDSWETIDYVVIPPLDQSTIASRPTLARAIAHATLVGDYAESTPGSYLVYHVHHPKVKVP